MKHSTSKNKKQPPTPEARCVRYWPISMREELDQPIGFAPVCPTASTYPAAGRLEALADLAELLDVAHAIAFDAPREGDEAPE